MPRLLPDLDGPRPVESTGFYPVMAGRPSVLVLIIWVFAYLCAAAFGRWMMVVPEISITVWPPNGVILAALLIHPRQSWPWWIAVAVVGELTANALWFHNPILPALGYVVANGCEVLAGALLLSPFLKPPMRQFSTLKQVLAFLGLGVLVAPVVGATFISSIDALIGKGTFLLTWWLLWLGDATGILIATPLVISVVDIWRSRARPAPERMIEAVAIALLIAGLAVWHFSRGFPDAFLLFIPILWTALRFQLAGTSLALLMLASLIGYFAQHADLRAAAEGSAVYRHAMSQALIMVAASMGLIVAATIRQHRDAVGDLAAANASLEDRVAERARDIEAAEKRFKATFENAAVGIAMVGADEVLVRVNDGLARMLGYRADEMEGRPLDRFTHPDDVSKGHAAMARLRRGETDEYETEKRYLSKDGKTVWGHTSVSCVRHPDGTVAYGIKVVQDITDRKRSEEARQLLTREVSHRSKNMLATVQAIARQTAAKTPERFLENFSQRLQALAANQDLLVRSEWESVDLSSLVRSQLGHFAASLDHRIVLRGPAVSVSPSAAQAIGMAIHELSTNAAKYGALSDEAGRVEIGWSVEGDMFLMEWRETDGPAVTPPTSRGFGTTVLDAMARSALDGEVTIDYAETGLVWSLRCPFSALHKDALADLEPAG